MRGSLLVAVFVLTVAACGQSATSPTAFPSGNMRPGWIPSGGGIVIEPSDSERLKSIDRRLYQLCVMEFAIARAQVSHEDLKMLGIDTTGWPEAGLNQACGSAPIY